MTIWNYVFEFAQSDRRADAVVDALYRAFEMLSRYPDVGSERAQLPGGQLAFPKDGYVILYRKVGDLIEISRVSGGDADLLAPH